MHSIVPKTTPAVLLAALVSTGACAAGSAHAQQPARNVGASMVQPPQPPISGANARNPDNMPIKRPRKPTHDPIARRPPASSVQPK
jgi:hypothetical protein